MSELKTGGLRVGEAARGEKSIDEQVSDSECLKRLEIKTKVDIAFIVDGKSVLGRDL